MSQHDDDAEYFGMDIHYFSDKNTFYKMVRRSKITNIVVNIIFGLFFAFVAVILFIFAGFHMKG
jgi:hypothetical protein